MVGIGIIRREVKIGHVYEWEVVLEFAGAAGGAASIGGEVGGGHISVVGVGGEALVVGGGAAAVSGE